MQGVVLHHDNLNLTPIFLPESDEGLAGRMTARTAHQRVAKGLEN
jgi:hypothetical protein